MTPFFRFSTLYIPFVAALSLGAACGSALAEKILTDPTPILPPQLQIPKGLVLMAHTPGISNFSLVMDKSRRTLSLWQSSASGPKFIEAIAADSGRKNGNKLVSGDHRTPEGIYFFQKIKHPQELNFNEYGSRAFTMDYPNFFDRQQGKTGNGIWLHAVPPSKSLRRGSRGCIVIRNEKIKKLESYILPKSTAILVQQRVDFISPQSWLKEKKQWLGWLEDWRSAWESRDLDRYISHYSSDFKALGMDKNQWRKYKALLNAKYSFIKISVSKARILLHQNHVVIKFVQHYASNKIDDQGEKTLYLHKTADGFRILGEEWTKLSRGKRLASEGSPKTIQKKSDISSQ